MDVKVEYNIHAVLSKMTVLICKNARWMKEASSIRNNNKSYIRTLIFLHVTELLLY